MNKKTTFKFFLLTFLLSLQSANDTFSITNSTSFCLSMNNINVINADNYNTFGTSIVLGSNQLSSTINLFTTVPDKSALLSINNLSEDTPTYFLIVDQNTNLLKKLPISNYIDFSSIIQNDTSNLKSYGINTSNINSINNNNQLNIHTSINNSDSRGSLVFGSENNPSDIVLNSDITFINQSGNETNNVTDVIYFNPSNPLITTDTTVVSCTQPITAQAFSINEISLGSNSNLNFQFLNWTLFNPLFKPTNSVILQGNLIIGEDTVFGKKSAINYQIHVTPGQSSTPFYYLILDNNNFLSRMPPKSNIEEIIETKFFNEVETITIYSDTSKTITIGNQLNQITLESECLQLQNIAGNSDKSAIIIPKNTSFETVIFHGIHFPTIKVNNSTKIINNEITIEQLICNNKLILKKVPTIKKPSYYLCTKDNKTLHLIERAYYEKQEKLQFNLVIAKWALLIDNYLALEKELLSELQELKKLNDIYFLLKKEKKQLHTIHYLMKFLSNKSKSKISKIISTITVT